MSESQYLIVEEWGSFIGRHSERLQVKKGGEILQEAPLLTLEGLILADRGVSLSTDAVAACADAGIPIHVVHLSGRVCASVFAAALTGTIETRRAQLRALDDPRGLHLARAFAAGKLRNQASLLRYLAKYRKGRKSDIFAQLEAAADELDHHAAQVERLQAENAADARERLLSSEGRGAARYWQAVQRAVAVPTDWPGRTGRGATDPVNATLNYGYGILYAQVERAVVLAGLDPYAGFIHADRPGKPSLVLDLIEEFRAPVVDRPVFAMINRRSRLQVDDEGLLTKDTRRAIADAVIERLDKPEKYERKQVALRHIIQSQARHVATFVRGERASYRPFCVKW